MLLRGKDARILLEQELVSRIQKLPFTPVFCDVLVGDDKASRQYVSMKEKYATSLGIQTIPCILPYESTTQDVVNKIHEIAHTPHMSGIIVQLPLPLHIDRTEVLDAVPAHIDVDCLSTHQSSLFYEDKETLIFPTVRAILHLLLPHISSSETVLIVGSGPLVGKPTAHILKRLGYTVVSVPKTEKDLSLYTKKNSIIISGAGIPQIIHTDMVSPNSIIVDAGTSEMDGSIVGDVFVSSLVNPPRLLAPVPGGVGPLTVYFLMDNVVTAAETMVQ